MQGTGRYMRDNLRFPLVLINDYIISENSLVNLLKAVYDLFIRTQARFILETAVDVMICLPDART